MTLTCGCDDRCSYCKWSAYACPYCEECFFHRHTASYKNGKWFWACPNGARHAVIHVNCLCYRQSLTGLSLTPRSTACGITPMQ